MAKKNNNTLLFIGGAGIAAVAFMFAQGNKKDDKAAPAAQPEMSLPAMVNRKPVKKKIASPLQSKRTVLATQNKKPKPPTKKQVRAKKRAANNTPQAKAARLQKTSMALDFMANIANSVSSTAANFKKQPNG